MREPVRRGQCVLTDKADDLLQLGLLLKDVHGLVAVVPCTFAELLVVPGRRECPHTASSEVSQLMAGKWRA